VIDEDDTDLTISPPDVIPKAEAPDEVAAALAALALE
jgi:hypothetical protein